MNDYLEFLERKKHSIGNYGIEPNYLPASLFDYQNYVAEYAIKKGRCAVFLDTGLGKTLIELVIAANYAKATNKPVLIITPLAVAFQFIKEAERFNIDDISHSKDGKYKTKIVVCNYERLQYEFLIAEIARVTKSGRITAVHCTDVIQKDGSLWDFPNEILKLHEKYGFKYRNRITIWKEPLKVRMRTMVKSLMHKLIVEDSTQCFTAMPDYVLIFKKNGENEVPVTHPSGLSEYFGEIPILPAMAEKYGTFEQLKAKYANHEDPKTNKLSHIIWQRYASSVWDDIRIENVLPFRDGKDEDDEKHVHPLQLDVIDRLVELYSNKGEVVLTPFMGVGSEVYSPVSLGRKAIGIELKDSYFKQAIENMKHTNERFIENQLTLL